MPAARAAHPFTVIATRAAVSGIDAGYLHYGVGEDDSYFELRLGAFKLEARVTRPELAVRAYDRVSNASSYKAAAREGLSDVGWVASMAATPCAGDAAAPWPLEAGESGGRVLLDAFAWITAGGAGVVDVGAECAGALRLVEAKAMPRNLLFKVACAAGAAPDAQAGDGAQTSVVFAYSVAMLPDEPMEIRRGDDRVGYFGGTYVQLGPLPADVADASDPDAYVTAADVAFDGDLANVPRLARADADKRINFIHRWRLAKDAGACGGAPRPVRAGRADHVPPRGGRPLGNEAEALSPLRRSHLDPTLPRARWSTIKKAVLCWNEAFEEIGYDGAVAVLTADDPAWPADYDPAERALLVGLVAAVPEPRGLAIGPSHVDARTGEILYANIVFGEGWIAAFTGSWVDGADARRARARRRASGRRARARPRRRRRPPRGTAVAQLEAPEPGDVLGALHIGLVAQGAIALGEAVPSEFVRAGLHDVVSHEVGHTLGLRHNFRASAMYDHVEVHSLAPDSRVVASSVMDYVSPIVAPNAADQGAYFMQTIGPYDKFCMRYGSPSSTARRRTRATRACSRSPPRPTATRGSRARTTTTRSSRTTRARRARASRPTRSRCDEQAMMTKRFLAALDPDDETQAERHGLDAVWARAYPGVYGLAGRSLRMWWHYCGAILPTYVRARLDYDRTRSRASPRRSRARSASARSRR